jgi:hypothetical protein
LIGKAANEIAPPNFVLRNIHLRAGLVDDSLDDVRRFGASCAAIRIDRRRVRKARRHFAIDDWRRVLAREQSRIENSRDAGRERRQISAQIRGRVHAQREEFAILVERQLRMRHVIAAVRVGEKGFAPLGRPLDRPAHAFRRPYHRRLFGVQIDLRAEATADVRRNHAHFVFGQSEHECRHQQPFDVRVLVRDVENVRIVRAIVRGDGGARLDRIRDEPVVDEIELGHVRRFRECGVDRSLVADRPRVALVAHGFVVNLRRAGFQRVDDVNHGRQYFVVDLDQFGGILRLVLRFGDHQCDLIADIAHFSIREHRMRRFFHRRAVDARDEPAAGQAVDAFEVGSGVDGDHARRILRLARVDGADPRVRMRRAEEVSIRLIRQRHVVRVLPGAGQEARVLLALDRLADESCVVRAHDGFPYFAIAAAPCCTALTML